MYQRVVLSSELNSTQTDTEKTQLGHSDDTVMALIRHTRRHKEIQFTHGLDIDETVEPQ